MATADYQTFRNYGVLLCLNTPPGTRMGLDGYSWQAGPYFRGIKMIPPGMHYFHYSPTHRGGQQGESVAPCTGFFFELQRGTIKVLQWDQDTEDFLDESKLSAETVAQQQEAVRSLAHDRYLGPYSQENTQRWLKLSYFVTGDVLRRLEPVSGKIVSNNSGIEEASDTNAGAEEETFAERCKHTDPERLKLQLDRETKGFLKQARFSAGGNGSAGTSIFFSRIRGVGQKSSSSEKTEYGVDTSFALASMLEEECKWNYRQYYGELQLAFIAFLLGESLESFEQWKRLVDMTCRAEKLLINEYGESGAAPKRQFWEYVFGIIELHVQEMPEDFFMDELSKENFLGKSLSCLKGTLSSYQDQIDSSTYSAAEKLLRSVSNRFGVNFMPEPRGHNASVEAEVVGKGNNVTSEQLKALLGPEWDASNEDDLPPVVDLEGSTF
eukprot:gb/GECG01000991.1/.p1 GENE.gb/GECG01000991.1/~~gb/GECG01000991.1/.p1  ORF type:complete len:438 (+),score=66.17 gb/GECG01000991.1/:1-1314(+)